MAILDLQLCAAGDIPRGKRAVFDLPDSRQILVFHTRSGYVAVENRCPHAGATLTEGLLKGRELMCVWHGWRFDLESGSCTNHPGVALTRFPVSLKNNHLIVHIAQKDR